MQIKDLKELYISYADNLRPISAMIELTNNCNLNCRHCYICRKPAIFLDIKVLENALLQLKKLGCLRVTYSGGEPLTHPDFYRILEMTGANGFMFSVFTNGTIDGSRLIQALKNNPKFNSLHISFYGLSDATHNSITRCAGSCAKVKEFIAAAAAAKLPFILKTAIMKQNYAEWEDIMEFCAANNFRQAMEFTF